MLRFVFVCGHDINLIWIDVWTDLMLEYYLYRNIEKYTEICHIGN
jgi:hypothetical protein